MEPTNSTRANWARRRREDNGRIETMSNTPATPLADLVALEWFRNQAREHYQEVGQVEIDPDAEVREADKGAWVQAWVWVPE